MNIKVKNYTIYQKENNIIIEIADIPVADYPFLNSNVYVSKKNIEKNIFFIIDDNKNKIIFEDIPQKELKILRNQKKLTVALISGFKDYKNIYELDVKNIK